MALVKKCDLCGKVFEHISDKDELNKVIITHVDLYGNNLPGYATAANDLCPDCITALGKFFESRKGIKNDVDSL